MLLRLLAVLVTAAAFCAPGFAQAPVAPGSTLPPLGQGVLRDQMDKVKATKRLPVYGLSIVETVDGMVFLISDNGRFAVIGGRWVDLWSGKNISGIADSASLDKIDFGRMGINVDEFSPFVVGSGPKTIIAFVDPTMDQTRPVLRQMESHGKQFTFKVVLLPLQGGPAGAAARRIHCAPNRSLAMASLLNGSLESLPAPKPDCDVSPVQKSMIAATILGIRTLPFFILPDATTASMRGSDVALADVLRGQ